MTKYKLELYIDISDKIEAENEREALEMFIAKNFTMCGYYMDDEVSRKLENLISIDIAENE